MKRQIEGNSSWKNLDKSFESVMNKVFTTSYASMKDFPRFPFFFLLSSPFSLSRQIRHLFRRLGLEGGLSIRSPRRSTIDCYVYRRKALFNACQCWRSGVISCIVYCQYTTEKEDLVFAGFWCFAVVQSWQCYSVYARNIEDVRKCSNSPFRWFSLAWVFPHHPLSLLRSD